MATNFVWYRTCSLGAKVSQDPLDRFTQTLHHMVGIELQMITTFYFFRYLKGRRHGNLVSGKYGAKLPTPLHSSLRQSKMEWDIATSMSALTAQVMSLYRVKNFVNFDPVTPEKTGLICILFFTTWQKTGIYSQISQDILY